MTGRVFTKLLLAFVLVLSISAAILDFTLRGIVEHSLRAEAAQSLVGKARLLASEARLGDSAQLHQAADRGAFDAGAQVTFYSRDGAVLASSSPADSLNTIPDEVRAALADPRDARQSERDGMLYVAVAGNGLVVRLAYPLTSIRDTMHVLRRDLLLASLLATGLATLLAAFFAHRAAQRLGRIVTFAGRISAGDFKARIEEGNLDEISEVAHALDSTAARLEASFHAQETKQRELAALLDSMQEGVIAVDAGGRISWSNAVMQRIAPGAVRQGQALVHAVRDPEVLACVQAALENRELRSGKATSVVPARIFEVNAAPTPGGGAVAVLHDVTEIERAEKTRRDFVANVSHELRTPLTSISGYVETLLEDTMELPTHAREFMAIILRNASRMNRLTEDLLALASVESGDYKVKPRPVTAAALMQDAIDSLTGMVLDSDVTLEAGHTTNAVVLADEDALTQVFGNLIENAMKYGKGGKSVVVGAREVEGFVEFSVQDFGPGIGSEHLSRIFERFYRVDKARSRDSGGTGLGLAIAKHIVLAHGGGIRVESELGSGATFLFTLPVVNSSPVVQPAHDAGKAAPATA
ncbi:two-component system phosphate regulon sensor histidine kinase PhoR [Silvibacterium bohemicum]|uniref:histidine kinase n=1 Tax=Silvibacterium bohemicum TaxID=1577686 RepID=A0A841JZY0_9BACT|nr:HAMP domain-containing sensor histidine kinase [Silvibacterium bohemicum]MBB6143978.1 two-component system phosphate regulon sensor histidine kinase PhoR [Silvibacterium bohemicum]